MKINTMRNQGHDLLSGKHIPRTRSMYDIAVIPNGTVCHCLSPTAKNKENNMANKRKSPDTLEGVRQLADESPCGRWIGKSAIERVCAMAG